MTRTTASAAADSSPPPTWFTAEDRTADVRDRTAVERDRASEARDRTADERDAQAARAEEAGCLNLDAAADRAAARRDREAGATDRKHAEDDRDAASADRVRAAVERANLVVDGLTGAHARAPGLAELQREVVRARRVGQSLVIAFIDVDGLKKINDTRGHAVGDQVLRHVVAVVKRALRDYDIVVRYGGDEFVCGLLDLHLDDAARRFASMQAELAGDGMAFTVGLAVLGDADTLQEMINRADKAMYRQREARIPVQRKDG